MDFAAATADVALATGDEFREAAAHLKDLVANDLTAVDAEIRSSLASQVGMIPDLAGHLVNSGGKRLRPLLALVSARLCGYAETRHVKLAAAVELIHAATLLHDDVVDASALRRGSKTANEIWGNKESVLVGDFLFSRSFELMVAAGDLRVLQILSRASSVIAEGEVLQLVTQNNLDATFEMHIAVVEAKTAALFSAAAQSGAAVAGARPGVEAALRSFGSNLGIAYQLVDDALDYSGFESTLGKRVGDDFREGKMTLPIVYALQRADADDMQFWKRTVRDGTHNADDFQRACAILRRTGAIDAALDCARRYVERAVADIRTVPQNDYSRALARLAEASAMRRA